MPPIPTPQRGQVQRGLRQTPRNKQAERQRLKQLTIDQMSTKAVLMRLYKRHEVGFWRTIAALELVLIVALTWALNN